MLSASPTDTYQNATAQRAEPMSPIHQLGDTFTQMQILTSRVRNLADRLCGETPNKQADVVAPSRPGIFGAIEATATNANEELSSAFTALDRIERELP